MKLVVKDRIKLTLSDKKGNKFMSIGVEKDIPEGMSFEVIADDAYNTASKLLEQKMSTMEEAPQAPQRQQSYGGQQRSGGNRGGSAQVGLCKECGTQMVRGKGGKPYCVPCYIAWKEGQSNSDIPF